MRNYGALQSMIRSQISDWRGVKGKGERGTEGKAKPFVTISREYGCGAMDVAEKMACILNDEMKPAPNWMIYDRYILEKISDDLGLSADVIETLTVKQKNNMRLFFQSMVSDIPSDYLIKKKQGEIIRTLAMNGHVIIVGRSSTPLTRDLDGGFHVRLVATLEWRIARISRLYRIKRGEAEKMIKQKNRQREYFRKRFFRFDDNNPSNFHIVVNLTKCSIEEAARIIVNGLSAMRLQ